MRSCLEEALQRIEQTTRLTAWMHLDAAGRVRVGAGMLLEDDEAARRLPFQVRGRAATGVEIGEEYRRVAGLRGGQPPARYRAEHSPELEREVMEALLRTSLVGLQMRLRELAPEFDYLDGGVRVELLRVGYRGGVMTAARGLVRQSPGRLAAAAGPPHGGGKRQLLRVAYGMLGAGADLAKRLRG